ncbi:sugar phosphate isomerase/epimerase family protein [Tenacibaculum xiamenense]|uniref:sugar phosphate isomerase/epimerase family protein n=1 Tax=Tenacibaculum xiamenense TaxID=1261553 RepID=UPI003896742C
MKYSQPKKIVILVMLLLCVAYSCKKDVQKTKQTESPIIETKKVDYKLSLAQWSLHKGIFDGSIDPMNFAEDAKNLGFEGLEYVSQLYVSEDVNYPYKEKGLDAILKELKKRSDSLGMKNLIIMIDREGDLSFSDEELTNKAIENHKKWIDAAQFLGCHSIRINLFGEDDEQLWVKNSVRSLKKLVEYSKPKNVAILVENHGGNSSKANLLAEVMKQVNSDYCGTLPDFGNFCTKREGNARWAAPCVEEYDIYKGIEELMPYAKGVSAKSYAFDETGNETKIDYQKMFQIVEKSNFEGFVGVEYEGSTDYKKGILKTKELVKTCINNLNN